MFEAHWFSTLTHHQFSQSHADISCSRRTPALYSTGPSPDARGITEHKRLQRATALNREAGKASASSGRFEIMGFNGRIAGCLDLQAFINAMYRSEGAQLDCSVEVIKHMRLDDELRDHRWADFAFVYNGPAYQANAYYRKMADE